MMLFVRGLLDMICQPTRICNRESEKVFVCARFCYLVNLPSVNKMLAVKIVICVVEDFKVFGEKVKAMPRVRFKMPRAEPEPTTSGYVSRAPFPSFSLLLGIGFAGV